VTLFSAGLLRATGPESTQLGETRLVAVHSNLVLCVDDNDFLLEAMQSYLRSKGFRVIACSSGKIALMLLASGPVDAVVVDYEMPEMNGAELAAAIRLRNPFTPIVMFSGSGDVPANTLRMVDRFVEKNSGFFGVSRVLESLLSGNDGGVASVHIRT